ncbi:MAG: CAP domain-containing protein [Dehalococcoidia bacterium]
MVRIRPAALWLAVGSLVFFSVSAVANVAPARALTNCSVADMTVDSQEAQFLTLINNYRAQNGRSALQMSTNLNRASTWMAVDLATRNYFSHTDSSGRSPSTRAQNCDYPGGAGENIAAGTVRDTAQEAFDAWKASSGHNANMLNSSYRMIGIARHYRSGSQYGWYWVTNFGLVNDGTSGGSTGGGGAVATPTPTRTPTPAASAASPANMTAPSNGSTLPGSSASFSWSAASGALEYFFYAGTAQGSNNITGRSTGLSRSTSVTNLPTNGSTVHVRLWTRFSTGWQYRDTSYKAATVTAATPPPTTSPKAALTSPSNGSTLGTSATFQWTAASGALEYFVYLGTTQGSNNLFGKSMGTSRGVTLSSLPRGGSTIYLRLWTRTASGWQYNDYTFRTSP